MSSSNFGNIQYKASNGQINLDEAQGIVECFVAGIGNKDSVGDICATGAFAKSLQRRKPRVVWGHNWNDPIGKVLEIYEVPVNDPRLPMKMKMAGIGGLYAKVQFNLQSEKGREAFANVAFFGEEQEWSIGYKTLRSQFDQNLQANVLYEVELYEVSPVLHGANQLTGTISVKSDEEKMHGMMPLAIGAPTAGKPSGDGLFDEGVAQRISGSQLAGVVAELSRRAGGPVMVVEATENSVVFVKPGKGKFRIGYHFTGSEYMFGKPELLEADQPKPAMSSGPAPMPGISAKPTGENKPQMTNPAMPMPVAMKPENGGMVIVPLPPVQYEGGEGKEKPTLVAEERELAESLVRIAGKYGKFDEDGDGIWAGYYPPAENKVKDIGVKCANCVLYQGNGKCKILALDVEPEGKCRFAIIPDGVVVGFGKKEYNDMLDEDEVKMVEDVEAKYPGEFILGAFRNIVKKRRKKRKEYKTLEEWGIEEQELAEKGLDPFLALDASYVIPVNPEDAFAVKSILDPVFEYHRIDTYVNEFGIVINSPLDQESKDAIETATSSAYSFLKKKLETEGVEEKALGRRIGRAIGSRAIDRPNIGGGRRRGGRGLGMPSGDLDPRTRRDTDLDGILFDNVPGWEQPDPTPSGPGSVNNPKPSTRQVRDIADDAQKLSSGKRNERRHADRSADMEAKFPNPEEMSKRKLQEDIAEQWISQGLGWEEVPRYNADKGKSSDYLRGRELGINQSRIMWQGDDRRKRPAKFDEKAKSSSDYKDWYMDYANAVSKYLDANAKEGDDNWAGIEEALKTEVYEKRPDTSTWRREDVDAMGQTLDSLGLNPQRGVRSSLKDREPAPLSSGKRRGKTPSKPAVDVDKPKEMPSDKEIYDRRMGGETLEQVAEDLGVDRIAIRKAEQRHMAKLREDGKMSSGRELTSREIEKQEMDAADESLRNFLNRFDGWDDEEWEFDNQLDGAVEGWASANEDMPWINTSVQNMIDELDADESVEGQNKLAFLKNLRESLLDAQYRANYMSDDERSRDRLERSVRRSQRDFDEGIFSSGRRTPEEIVKRANSIDAPSFDRSSNPYERLNGYESHRKELDDAIRELEDSIKEVDENSPEWEMLTDALDDLTSKKYDVENQLEDMSKEKERLDDVMSEAAKMVSAVDDLRNARRNINEPTEQDIQELSFEDAHYDYLSLSNDITDVTDEYGLAVDWTVEKQSDIEQALRDGDYNKADEIFYDVLQDMYNIADNKYRDAEAEYDDYPFVDGFSSGKRNKFSRNLDPQEEDRVFDFIDNMSADERKEYEQDAADYLVEKGMSPNDPDWGSELEGRIEEVVADNINESLYDEQQTRNLGEPSPTTRASDVRSAPQATGRDFFSSGRAGDKLGKWQKTDNGYESDAPGIDGLYTITEGEDGKFYVTRSYDAIREGGQYQMDTEHDFGFADINSAKKWAENDYGKATSAWNYDQVYGAEEADADLGFSSGRTRAASSVFNVDPTVNPEMGQMLKNRDDVPDSESSFSSGRTRGQRAAAKLPKVGATDKEIFERRMEGASLEDVANELGVPRQVVRQAEQRHMARMRGTLDTPVDSSLVQDYVDVEDFARDMQRMAEIEAAQERADELFHSRITAGESATDIAKEYGITPGQVIEGSDRHGRFLKDLDAQAEAWKAENPALSSGRRSGPFKNPMEGMFPGQGLSSGKQDEVYKAVQDRLIKMLEEADPDSWEFPWHKSGFVPSNPSNKNRPYTNVNALMLMFAQQDNNYTTPMWAGFEQWKKLGGSVRKGEKGTQIFIPTIVPPKKDKDGNELKKGFIFFKVGHVFNADQIDGIDIDSLKGEQLDPAERVQELEDALSEVGAIVKTGTDGRAYYRPSTDEISMPPFEAFKSKEGYYATLAHEMMHWTGHSSRLNRPNMNQFGNEAYAREELVAEIASAFFLAALGVSAEPREDHAQYLASWLRALKNDPNALQQAFGDAQKAADFVIGKSPKMQKKLGKSSAEKGALPGNKDLVPSMPDVAAPLSSGRGLAPDGRPFGPRFMKDSEGNNMSLADVLGKPSEGVLGEFEAFTYPEGRGQYDKDYFVRDSDVLGSFGRWHAGRDESGRFHLDSLVFDDYGDDEDRGDDDNIDRDFGGVSRSFDSAEEMADFIQNYEDERREFKRAYNEAVENEDLERVQKLIDEESKRRDDEYALAKRNWAEAEEREKQENLMYSWEEISRQFDEETANWSAEDWQDHAADLQSDFMREESRFSSGRVSRYNDADPTTIPNVKGAAGRDDEIGSNAREIIKNTYVPTDLYDLNDVRANGTPIRFKYKGKDRTIYPTGIKAKKEGGIYFIGVDEESGQYRSFNLEKIEGLIDGAMLPTNPRQPGVAKGDGKQVYVERFSSGRNKRRRMSDEEREIASELEYMDNTGIDPMTGLPIGENQFSDETGFSSGRKKRPAGSKRRRISGEERQIEQELEYMDSTGIDPMTGLPIGENDDWTGFASGRKKRPASSKRRPMSDEEMQAYRDGLRLRAKTIPKKRRGGPEASEFSSGRTTSGKRVGLAVTDSDARQLKKYFERLDNQAKAGNVADNDMRGPLDTWQVPVAPLLKLLGRERIVDGEQTFVDMTPEMLGELLGMTGDDLKKIAKEGASISDTDAYELIQMLMGGADDPVNLMKTDGYMQAIWGWNAAPYWYDVNDRQIDKDTFDELMADGEYVYGLNTPLDVEIPDTPSAPEAADTPAAPSAPVRKSSDKSNLAGSFRKSDFTIQKFAEFLGVQPGDRKAMMEEIKNRTDGRITVTSTTIGSWNTDGVPAAYAEVFRDLGLIENAEQIWGEAGRAFDQSMGKIEFHKRLDALLKKEGAKISDSKLSRILGANNLRKEINTPEKVLSIDAKISRGMPPRYSEVDMARHLDTINEELNTGFTLDDIRGTDFSSGRRASRRVAQVGREAAETLSSGRKNNGAPENITPRMQNELIGWARKNTWSGFATSLVEQFDRNGFLSATQWTKLLRLVDNQNTKR